MMLVDSFDSLTLKKEGRESRPWMLIGKVPGSNIWLFNDLLSQVIRISLLTTRFTDISSKQDRNLKELTKPNNAARQQLATYASP